MKTIVLACVAGMSTSMLVAKMQEVAEQNKLDVNIYAIPVVELEKHLEEPDVILLGPQVAYQQEAVAKKIVNTAIRLAVIDRVDYGMMNGKKVLLQALKLMDA